MLEFLITILHLDEPKKPQEKTVIVAPPPAPSEPNEPNETYQGPDPFRATRRPNVPYTYPIVGAR